MPHGASADRSIAAVTQRVAVPWALLSAWFFITVTAWIVGGFLGWDLSLTLTLFPVVIATILAAWIRGLGFSQGSLRVPHDQLPLALLSGALLGLSVTAWCISAVRAHLPLGILLYNLIVPVGVFAIHAALWTTELSTNSLRRLFLLLCIAAAFNALLSAATLIFVNVFRIVPTEIFYLNPRYPVILFRLRGEAWVRTPGMFETGGSNGSFLLLTFILLLSFLLFRHRAPAKRNHWLGWVALGLNALLLLATLTRRSILGMIVAGVALVGWYALTHRKVLPAAVLALLAVVGGTLSLSAAPELATAATLLQRVGHWQSNINELFGQQPTSILTGFGLLQPSLDFLEGLSFEIVDNAFLELLLYGGLPYLALFLCLYLLLFQTSIRLVRRAHSDVRWLAHANVVLLATFAVVSLFVPFVFNITESYPIFLAVNVIAKWLLESVTPVARILTEPDASPS